MDRKELIAEIKRLNRLLNEAHKSAVAQYVLIDKLTAAGLYVQSLLKKLILERSGAAERRRKKG
jgi:hypothetical protein